MGQVLGAVKPRNRRVLLVDDHVLVRTGLAVLIGKFAGWEVVGEASNGELALELVEELEPDVVIMDVSMPVLDGIEATRRMVKKHGSTVLILSMHSSREHVREALRAGARGYLVKTSTGSELELALGAVARREAWLSPTIANTVVDDLHAEAPPAVSPLTPRQLDVLKRIAEGKSTREVAHLLGVSVKTVETHRAQIMDRLDIHNVAGLVRYALAAKIVEK
jgi:DNA-binding NarL/FixJ family response regulator